MIRAALRELSARVRLVSYGIRTTLMITLRFTTARHADLIQVVERGRIVESGTHEQLITHGGTYEECWFHQMGEACA